MVKRYYCDYCDRSFPYSVEARKKHINGYHHQKLWTLHYNQYKSAVERLQDESRKEKCRRFHSGQECSFGDACIYSHLTVSDLNKLKEEVIQENAAKEKRPNTSEPSLEKWIAKKLEGGSSVNHPEALDEKDWVLQFKTPGTSMEQDCLPPSLIPITLDSLVDCQLEDWG